MVAFKVSNILLIVFGAFLAVYHFATMIAWFVHYALPYGVFNIFLIFADIFIILVGVLGLLLSFGKVTNEKLWTSLHGGASLFGVPAICFILFLQWTTEFSSHYLYMFFFLYSNTTTPQSQIRALTYINPSFAVIFNVVLLGLTIFQGITSFMRMKEVVPELFNSLPKPQNTNV